LWILNLEKLAKVLVSRKASVLVFVESCGHMYRGIASSVHSVAAHAYVSIRQHTSAYVSIRQHAVRLEDLFLARRCRGWRICEPASQTDRQTDKTDKTDRQTDRQTDRHARNSPRAACACAAYSSMLLTKPYASN
jgi:hypothetical protein